MRYVLAVLMGYLLGCSSMAYYIGKRKKKDIRTAGSGNLGASNATVLFGWGAGVMVALHDIGKAVLAVLLAKWLFPELEYAGAAAGVACVLGHIFPFYLGFKGGKGLASYFGMTLALNWKLALIVAAVIVLATLITDFISVGALSSIVVVPAYMGFTTHNLLLVAILGVATVVMFGKHWENIVRIAKGQEIGLRRTVKGTDRVDQ
ncbi:MAG: glycerol-3-phosphate acyltransferase [Oscillospiraceae bacterium]|nr:glycerol-3-phosphate acyltransferase [Oscillospiraceae bacterium]